MLQMIDYIVVKEISIIVILFLIGIFIARWYAKDQQWSPSLLKALVTQIPWLVIKLLSVLLLIFPIIETIFSNLFFIIEQIVMTSLIGMLIVSIVYKKKLTAALIFIIVVQVILFVLYLLFDLLFNLFNLIVVISMIEFGPYRGGEIMYFISLFILLGVSIFFSSWLWSR